MPGLIQDTKNLYEQAGRKERSIDSVALILGHKSANSGTYKTKLASLRAYGLIDGRGQISVSDLGEKIARPKSEEEYNESVVRVLKNIPLWSSIYDKYTAQGKTPLAEQLWLDLEGWCGLEPAPAKEKAPLVLKEYLEDARAIRAVPVIAAAEMQKAPEQKHAAEAGLDVDAKNFDVFAINENKVILSKNPDEARDAWELLRTIVDKKYGKSSSI